ncbi:MAG: LarC family nickel insertion protein [Chthoniobacter sp.]|nr:LarC family nickel insertion protein [Chthoniobacter sp.]
MAGGYDTDIVTRLETNLDDLSPEITGAVMEKLLAAGALDVWFTPIQMKKSRPAVQLSVLCEEARAESLADIIFTETSAFGLRMEKIARLKLERRFETVTTKFGDISVKLGLKQGRIIQTAPEFASCLSASERTGQPLRAIYAAALAAYAAQP